MDDPRKLIRELADALADEHGDAGAEDPSLLERAERYLKHRYTAFCQEADGTGTIWIGPVEAPTLDAAIDEARKECAADWGFDGTDGFGKPEDIHVLGIAAGVVTILFWEDVCDAGA